MKVLFSFFCYVFGLLQSTDHLRMAQQYHFMSEASLVDNEKSPIILSPKTAPRWRILLSLLAFHLAPTVITIGIVLLNALNIWWRAPGIPTTSELLRVLQFVAKAHELLIILSISQILLSWLIYWLTTGNGVPYRLFTAAFHVFLGGTPLDKNLWSSLTLAFKNVKLIALVLLLFATTIFGLSAGPASAIF